MLIKSNDLLERVAKLTKIHKTQVGVKNTYLQIIKPEEKLKIKIQDRI